MSTEPTTYYSDEEFWSSHNITFIDKNMCSALKIVL